MINSFIARVKLSVDAKDMKILSEIPNSTGLKATEPLSDLELCHGEDDKETKVSVIVCKEKLELHMNAFSPTLTSCF